MRILVFSTALLFSSVYCSHDSLGSEPLAEKLIDGATDGIGYRGGPRVIKPEKIAKIDQSLSAPLGFEVNSIPLVELLKKVAEVHHVPIWLDQASMDLVGISSSTPCSVADMKVPVWKALQQVLEPLRLSYTYSNEVLRICPKGDALQVRYSLVYAFPAVYEREDVTVLLQEIGQNKSLAKNAAKPIVKILRLSGTDGKNFHLFVEANTSTHQRIRSTLELLGKLEAGGHENTD